MWEGHSFLARTARTASLAVFFILFFAKVAWAAPDHLVITQVQITGGTGKTSDDVVELYNSTSQSIDLNGYRLVKRTATGTADTTLKSWTASAVIPAGGFYRWANTALVSMTPAPDTTTSGTIANDNTVTLRQGAENIGEVVDAVSLLSQNPGTGETLQRVGDGGFKIGPVVWGSYAMPTVAVIPSVAEGSNKIMVPEIPPLQPPIAAVGRDDTVALTHLLITRVQTVGPNGETEQDFVELFNSGSGPIDLKGYRLVKRTATGISDTTLKSWTSSLVIEAGDYYRWINLGQNGVLSDDNVVALRHGSEDTGEIIDAVGWGNISGSLVESMPFPTNPLAGQSLSRTGSDTNNNAHDFVLLGEAKEQPKTVSKSGTSNGSLVTAAISRALKDIREPVKPSQSKIFLSEIVPAVILHDLPTGQAGIRRGGSQFHSFIELENHGDAPVVLTDWLIKVDSKIVYRFDPDGWEAPTLGPRDFRVVIKKTWQNWPASAKVQLVNADGKIIDETKYDQAEPELSWTRFDDEWQWGTLATPGRPNEVQLPVACLPVLPTGQAGGKAGSMEHVAQNRNCHREEVDMGSADVAISKTSSVSEIATPTPAARLAMTDTSLEIMSPSDLTDDLVGQRFVLRGEVSRKTTFGFWLSEDGDKIYVPLKEAPVGKGQTVKLLGLLKEKSGRFRFEPEGAVVVSKLSEVSKLSKVSTDSEDSVRLSSSPAGRARVGARGDNAVSSTYNLEPKTPQDTPWPKVAAGTAGLTLLWQGLKLFKKS